MHGRPLAAAAALFALGAGLGIWFAVGDLRWLPLACAAVAIALAALGAMRGRTSLAWLAAALAAGLLRGGCTGVPARDPALDASIEAAREPLAVEARVVESERARAGVRRVLLDLEARELKPGGPLERAPRPLRALVAIRETDDPARLRRPGRVVPRPGDRVRLLLKLRVPSPRMNPGASDRRRQLALRGIGYEGTAVEDALAVLARGPAWARTAGEVRDRFARRCADVCGSPERGALVAALAVGDRADLPPEVDDDLAASGLIHLLASAGLHVAAVCVLIQRAVQRAWLRTPWAARVRAALVGSLAAIPFAAVEVVLLGAPWPAIRAGVSSALWLSAGVVARRADSVTALGLSAALCALADPGSLHDLALQLSLAGVAGLIFLTSPIRDLLPIAKQRFAVEHAIRLGCATAAATLCTAPLLAAWFHRVSAVSILANALALWPGLLAIPLATAAVPLDLIWQPLALPFLWVADVCALLTLRAAAFFASLPGARIPLASPSWITVVLWVAALLALAGFPARIGPGTALDRPAPRTRLRRAAVPLAVLALVWAGEAAAARLSRKLTITFLAVGQGDATLIQFPGGRTMLVDGGGALFGGIPGRDPGTTTIVPALAQLGISRLDWAVLTHPHPDHGEGLLGVLERVGVGELWTTGEPGPGALGDRVRAKAREKGARLLEPSAGQSFDVEGVRVEVLHPTRFDPRREPNDNSLVLRLVHGQVSVLLAGDVEALAESELAQGAAPIRATLLKAPHHGSRTSSTDAFVRRVAPRHVVFCVGVRNPFGFPHADVAARYEQSGCKLWRTDRGAVTAVSDRLTLGVRGPD